MNEIKSSIPNTITCLNLFTGCLAVVFIFNGYYYLAGLFVGIAAVFDFFDGMSARLLNVKSEIGKQLDSLADLVSFGLVPGLVMYQLICLSLFEYQTPFTQRPFLHIIFELAGFLIPVFSALRLANFNIDTRQTVHFRGLPTPANAILITSLPLMLHYDFNVDLTSNLFALTAAKYILNPTALVALSLVLSNLLIIESPFFSLKMKELEFKGHELQLIFVGLAALIYIVSAAVFQYFFLPIFIIMILYVILSLLSKKRILNSINTTEK